MATMLGLISAWREGRREGGREGGREGKYTKRTHMVHACKVNTHGDSTN